MPRIEPVDANSTPYGVTQHHVDPALSYDIKDRAPDVVGEPIDAVRILVPPLRSRGEIRRADMTDLTTPATIARYSKFASRRRPSGRHTLKQLVQNTFRASACVGVEGNLTLCPVIHDKPYTASRATLKEHEGIRPKLQRDLRLHLPLLIQHDAGFEVANFELARPKLPYAICLATQAKRQAMEAHLSSSEAGADLPTCYSSLSTRRAFLLFRSRQHPLLRAVPLRERPRRCQVREVSPPRVSLQLVDCSRVLLLEDLIWRKGIALIHTLKHTMQHGADHGLWARGKPLAALGPPSGRDDKLQVTAR